MTDPAAGEPAPPAAGSTGAAPATTRPGSRRKRAGDRTVSDHPSTDGVRYRPRGDNGSLRHALFLEWQQRCYWCETPTRFSAIEIDHILPHTVTAAQLQDLIAQHGLPADFDVHRPGNLAPICGTCNREKSNNRFTGTQLMGKLQRAADKQARVIHRVVSAAAGNDRAARAVAADQRLTLTAEVAARIRMLTERAQGFSDIWRQDFATTPDGIALRYTPKRTPAGPDGPGLPPLFDADAGAVAVGQDLADLYDYGGTVAVDGRYLITTDDDGVPSLAEVLGLTGPDDQVLISGGEIRFDPAVTFQLAVVTASGVVRERVDLRVDPGSTAGRRGARLTLQDGSGLFTARVQIDRRASGGTITTHHPAA